MKNPEFFNEYEEKQLTRDPAGLRSLEKGHVMTRLNVDWETLVKEGARHLRMGRYKQAGLWFEAAYRKAPDEPLACYALGRERMRQRRYLEAEVLLRKAWKKDSSLLPAAFALARLLGLHLDRHREANEMLDIITPAANREKKENVVALLKGELELRRAGGHKEAVQFFHKALDIGGQKAAAIEGLARAYNIEGITLARDGKPHEALFVLKKSADLQPDWGSPRVNMGVVFQALGKDERAGREYRQALEIEPGSPTALYNLGKLAVKRGEFEEAAGYYRTLMDLHPFYPGVRAALAELARRRRETFYRS